MKGYIRNSKIFFRQIRYYFPVCIVFLSAALKVQPGKDTNDYFAMAENCFTLAETYNNTDQLDSALYYYEQSLAMLQQAEQAPCRMFPPKS